MKPLKWLLIIAIIILTAIIIVLQIGSSKIAVLGYHGFTKEISNDEFIINEKNFEKQIKYLHDNHYHSLTLKEVNCYLKSECNVPKKSVLITIDDGYKSVLDIAIPILNKYNMNAVIFVIGTNTINSNDLYLNNEDIKNIKDNYPNIVIASHSYDMHYPDAYLKSKEDIIKDIEKQKEVIDTKYFAYPYGLYTKEYIAALKEEKYKMAFTFGPDKNHRKVKKDDSLFEIPRLNIGSNYPFWKFVLRLLLP